MKKKIFLRRPITREAAEASTGVKVLPQPLPKVLTLAGETEAIKGFCNELMPPLPLLMLLLQPDEAEDKPPNFPMMNAIV